MQKRKAISPAIVTILLMVVAIAGGMAVWQSMNTQAQTTSKVTKLDVVDVSLAKLQVGGKAFFSVTLKNSGTIPFDTIEAGFWDDSGKYSSFVKNSANLLPGEQWSDNDVFDATITINQKYTVKYLVLLQMVQNSAWQRLFLLWIRWNHSQLLSLKL